MFKELSLIENPLDKDFNFSSFYNIKKQSKNMELPLSVLNNDLVCLLNSCGLSLAGVVLFFKQPGGKSPVHVDLVFDNGIWVKWHCAINWNLTGAENIMSWWETKETPINAIRYPIQSGENYILRGEHYGQYNNRNLDLSKSRQLALSNIIRPTLLKTDIPHTVENTDKEKTRICISVRFKGNPSYEDVLEKLKVFI
jgi:hypothetical protein